MLECRQVLLDKAQQKYVTIYSDAAIRTKAQIFYFHGGGLIYGNRTDLPDTHISALTREGYEILAFDYPLAPFSKIDGIICDVCDSINNAAHVQGSLPYILWGRSAGAYLCLLAASKDWLSRPPLGIVSYYGFGFLCDDWFCQPNDYYGTLPKVKDPFGNSCFLTFQTGGDMTTRYSAYVYARQTGLWRQLIYSGSDKTFFAQYSMRPIKELPCELFAAHSVGDTDVPFEEFLALSERYHAHRFIAMGETHDFDRDRDNPFTAPLLRETLVFLESLVSDSR